MSGHSKWANIKNKKGKADAQRANLFTKIGRELAVAVRAGGPDPDSNSKLKDAIVKARANNMPNDNITRCIAKASGEAGGADFEEITYEGYGPRGVAVIVETLTNNRNRTAADLRHYFDKYGGNLGQNGCVSFMFDKKGVIVIEDDGDIDEDELMMAALDAGADDFNSDEEGFFEIVTDPTAFSAVYEALSSDKDYNFITAEVRMVPQTMVELTDEEDLKKMNKLLEMLDDNDDVQNVYHNWDE
ncbi:MAG: YebC/PmpR family DNA-binding transcriptional regulator [Clostridia bacterium]|nr:YebC/PmpR family DNA-binding transcriptional regulator [Clostridia bacterium]